MPARLRRPGALGILGAIVTITAMVAMASATEAQDREAPVAMAIAPLFGPDVARPRSWVPIQVTLTNRTQRTFQGELELDVGSWRQETLTHRTRVDLPSGAERRVVIDVHLPNDGSELRGTYRTDGGVAGRTSYTSPYSSGGGAIVYLARESRLRSVVGPVRSTTTDEWGSTREVEMPFGSVPFDTATGEPIAPETTLGWAPVSLLVAGAPELEALSPTEQSALRHWIGTGGRLLIFPQTPEAVRKPFVRALMGEVSLIEDVAGMPRRAVPAEYLDKAWLPSDTRGWIDEPFGGSRRIGFGRVHLALYDGTAPPHVDAEYTRSTVDAVARQSPSTGESPVFALAEPEIQSYRMWGGMDSSGFSELRAALDPNESFRPALGLVALLLLLYVIVVGPVNFRWIAKRNRPILALVTTPIVAFGCLFAMLVVGYIGKGVTMRYRSVEMVESTVGSDIGSSREYLGLFLARPSTFDFPDAEGWRLLAEGSPRMPEVVTSGADRALVDLQGGLWQTLFLRRDRARDLGGAVTFGVEDGHLVELHNGTTLALLDAIIMAPGGLIYSVGDVAPGASAAIGSESVATVGQLDQLWGPSSPELRSLAGTLGLNDEAGREALYGLLRHGGGRLNSYVPVLLARIDEGHGELAGTFDPEQSLHLLRVVVPNAGMPVILTPKAGDYDTPVEELLPLLNELRRPDREAEPTQSAGVLAGAGEGAP